MYQPYVFPFLKKADFESLDPEITHTFYLHTLHIAQNQPAIYNLIKKKLDVADPRLEVNLFGLKFKNPIGAAAGFDKNGIAVKALSAIGFGSIEAGTVTPLPQYGKAKHRLFRLEEDCALINRYGFANDGVDHLKHHLKSLTDRDYIVGVNIGPNAKTVEEGDPLEDYVKCIKRIHELTDYFTINISSPNTEGLRLLQTQNLLDKLLDTVFKTVKQLKIKKPFLIKIAPDLTEEGLLELLDVLQNYPVAGIIVANTTLERPKDLISKAKTESGGLSGKPLTNKSTKIIRTIYKKRGEKLPIIGVGGVFTAADAIEKIEAGSSLVQLYTGFIFEGPVIVKNINLGLIKYMKKHRIKNIKAMVGRAVS